MNNCLYCNGTNKVICEVPDYISIESNMKTWWARCPSCNFELNEWLRAVNNIEGVLDDYVYIDDFGEGSFVVRYRGKIGAGKTLYDACTILYPNWKLYADDII